MNDFYCSRCGCTTAKTTIQTNRGGHYGKINCSNCGLFVKWIPKPKDQKPKDPRAEVAKNLVQLYSQGFCEICLRRANEIPSPQTLEGHHIVPVAQGGTDEPENIQICCTSCHRLIHHQRTYMGHYSALTEVRQ